MIWLNVRWLVDDRSGAKLDADHVPLRGIGEAVGVSFQRIHQLLNA